jgi:hypothetical protein
VVRSLPDAVKTSKPSVAEKVSRNGKAGREVKEEQTQQQQTRDFRAASSQNEQQQQQQQQAVVD